jgi:hypothetical protein
MQVPASIGIFTPGFYTLVPARSADCRLTFEPSLAKLRDEENARLQESGQVRWICNIRYDYR